MRVRSGAVESPKVVLVGCSRGG